MSNTTSRLLMIAFRMAVTSMPCLGHAAQKNCAPLVYNMSVVSHRIAAELLCKYGCTAWNWSVVIYVRLS